MEEAEGTCLSGDLRRFHLSLRAHLSSEEGRCNTRLTQADILESSTSLAGRCPRKPGECCFTPSSPAYPNFLEMNLLGDPGYPHIQRGYYPISDSRVFIEDFDAMLESIGATKASSIPSWRSRSLNSVSGMDETRYTQLV
jgi:hypothetical protein